MRVGRAVRFAACAAVLLAAPAVRADGPPAHPGLGGTWTFFRQRSDDLRQRLFDSLGQEGAATERERAAWAWVRDWLPVDDEHPDPGLLTIEESASDLKLEAADDVRIYYFGRETTRQGTDGVRRRASVRRDAGRVVVEERAEKGSGHASAAYALEAGGRVLLVSLRFEHKAMRQPLELTLRFARAPQ